MRTTPNQLLICLDHLVGKIGHAENPQATRPPEHTSKMRVCVKHCLPYVDANSWLCPIKTGVLLGRYVSIHNHGFPPPVPCSDPPKSTPPTRQKKKTTGPRSRYHQGYLQGAVERMAYAAPNQRFRHGPNLEGKWAKPPGKPMVALVGPTSKMPRSTQRGWLRELWRSPDRCAKLL